jgi:hypothetical protein
MIKPASQTKEANRGIPHAPAWLNGSNDGLDAGIQKAVERLQLEGIETFESCEGGTGHSYAEPTIRFHGTPEAGWRALGVCLAYGLPILFLRRIWAVLDANEPTGPYWEIVFRPLSHRDWGQAG